MSDGAAVTWYSVAGLRRADARAGSASSSRSAAASRATACARRCACSASASRSRSTRCRAGTSVLDWTVPDEWNIRDAYIMRPTDGASSTSRLEPPRRELQRARSSDDDARGARPHLHTHPSTPTGSRTARRTTHATGASALAASSSTRSTTAIRGRDRQHARARLLTYGECFLPGELEDEVLLTTHVCHPSLANDNLSGIAARRACGQSLANGPASTLLPVPLHPGNDRFDHLARRKRGRAEPDHGRPRRRVRRRPARSRTSAAAAATLVDRAAAMWSRSEGGRTLDFVPWGWDERQFNSPGFDLPSGV